MNKSTRNLLIIFVILAAIVFVFFKGKDKITTQKVQEKLFTADSSKIDKIEIVKTNESITLEKVNGIWQVSKPIVYPADTNAITPILGNLQNFKIESITSTNPEKFNNYLDSVNNTHVTVYQEGKNLGTFILGKYALSYMNSYVRIPDDNKILLASNLNQSMFVKPLKDFRNKVIWQIPTISLSKIEFRSTDSLKVNFDAVKDSAGRWFIGADSIPANNMAGFLNNMGAFTTEDFIDSAVTSFPQPVYTIMLIAGPQNYWVNLYKIPNTSPAEYMVQVSDIKQLFRFSESMARSVMKQRTDFVPAPPKEEKTDKSKK